MTPQLTTLMNYIKTRLKMHLKCLCDTDEFLVSAPRSQIISLGICKYSQIQTPSDFKAFETEGAQPLVKWYKMPGSK